MIKIPESVSSGAIGFDLEIKTHFAFYADLSQNKRQFASDIISTVCLKRGFLIFAFYVFIFLTRALPYSFSFVDPKYSFLPSTTPEQRFHYRNSSYFIIEAKMTWEDARKSCDRRDSSLASILDPFGLSYLWLKILKQKRIVWLGLNSNLVNAICISPQSSIYSNFYLFIYFGAYENMLLILRAVVPFSGNENEKTTVDE